MARVSPGRIAAVRVLIDVEEGVFADASMQQHFPQQGRDRSLARHLTYGVLRQRGEVDGAIRNVLKQPLSQLEPSVRAIVRIGVYEKLHSRTQEHAVVHQTVEMCRPLRVVRAKGLVNAVMRRVKPSTDLTLGERLNHPEWLIERWAGRYGQEAAHAWCGDNNKVPPLFIVGKPDFDAVAQMGGDGRNLVPITLGGRPLDSLWRLDGHKGQVSDLPGFDEGGFWIQDASAVLTADLCGEVDGRRVLDVCAAPGGKSFRLASRGGLVTSTDVSSERLTRLLENSQRLGLTVQSQVHDWEAGPMDGKLPFDVVLVDAPCTGLGVVRRKPEIRWRRMESDVFDSSVKQLVILSNASKQVANGGRLVYTVCSPEPEEGQEVVQAFMTQNPEFSLQDTILTAPPTCGEDAHFGAVLVRT